MQTLRERRNRDGEGLFCSSSERGHGDGGVMRSSFAARNIIFCKERCLRQDQLNFSCQSFLGAQKEAPRPHPFKGVLFFYMHVSCIVYVEKIILKLKTCCKSGKEHQVHSCMSRARLVRFCPF